MCIRDSYELGSLVVWVNKATLENVFSTMEMATTFLIRLHEGVNATEFAESIVEIIGTEAFTDPPYSSVTAEVDTFVNLYGIRMKASVDMISLVGSLVTIPIALVLYASEGLDRRRREIALLRASGATTSDIVRIETAEIVFIALTASMLLLFLGPLIVSNGLLTIWTSYYTYHFVVMPVFPVLNMVAVLLVFMVSMVVYAVAIGFFSTRISLVEALNADWAESSPLRSDL